MAVKYCTAGAEVLGLHLARGEGPWLLISLHPLGSVMWIRINMMRIQILGSAAEKMYPNLHQEKMDPNPALGERFFLVLCFPSLYFRFFIEVIIY